MLECEYYELLDHTEQTLSTGTCVVRRQVENNISNDHPTPDKVYGVGCGGRPAGRIGEKMKLRQINLV